LNTEGIRLFGCIGSDRNAERPDVVAVGLSDDPSTPCLLASGFKSGSDFKSRDAKVSTLRNMLKSAVDQRHSNPLTSESKAINSSGLAATVESSQAGLSDQAHVVTVDHLTDLILERVQMGSRMFNLEYCKSEGSECDRDWCLIVFPIDDDENPIDMVFPAEQDLRCGCTSVLSKH
jgi:hypothetical protein